MLLTPELVLTAYRQGYFPMAEPDGELYWHCPDPRAVIPLDGVKVSRSLRKTIARGMYEIRFDTAFEAVMCACADRKETWISDDIVEVYTQLHDLGYAHSVEAWLDNRLVGGLYGVAMGGAFFGESMFSYERDASKVAFVKLIERLRQRDFVLLDSQYINPHMASLGAIEVSRPVFLYQLELALRRQCYFP